MKVDFGPMKDSDIEAVIKLYDEARTNKTNMNKSIREYSIVKKNADYFLIVGRFGDEVVSFAKVVRHHDFFEETRPYLSVWSVRVDSRYRRQGIAKAMFDYIYQLGRDLKCDFICLIADKNNVIANNLYQSISYELNNSYFKKII